MTCVILQPSYVPWRGYFHQIRRADTFVFLDDVPYDRRGWRNRNKIRAPRGDGWLTIPVLKDPQAGRELAIHDVRIDWSRDWAARHRESIRHAYARAPHFDEVAAFLEPFYGKRTERLADFTVELTVALAREIGIEDTRFLRASELGAPGKKTEHLLGILERCGATRYLTGPSAADYLDEPMFAEAGVTLEYMRYDYPEYPQLDTPFDPQLSILDLLFMTGRDAGRFIWGDREEG